MRTFETVISKQWDQCTVEKVLRRELGLSVTRIKRAKFRPDGILLDGKRVSTVQRVSTGQVLQLNLPELEESDFVATAGEVAIAYEDQWLMVIDKPAGVAMYPGPGHYADTLGNRFVWLMQQRGEQCAFRPVNRLDIGTSGLLVVAKSADAHEALQKILHTDAFQRTYWALTEHTPQSEQDVIDAPIAPIAGELNRYTVAADGKPAQTEYQVLCKGTAATLVQLRLFTGRTHQIRVHMAHIGCPLLGDVLYGGGDGLSRPALHSKFLRIKHPFTGEWLELESATPADFLPFLEEN